MKHKYLLYFSIACFAIGLSMILIADSDAYSKRILATKTEAQTAITDACADEGDSGEITDSDRESYRDQAKSKIVY